MIGRSLFLTTALAAALWGVSVPANVAAAACPPECNGTMKILTEADAGAEVALSVGETIEVVLSENATTGYTWAIERIEPAVVTVAERSSRYPQQGAVGSGGHAVFRLTAATPGKGTVRLRYWREWEGDASAIRRFQFGVTVAP